MDNRIASFQEALGIEIDFLARQADDAVQRNAIADLDDRPDDERRGVHLENRL